MRRRLDVTALPVPISSSTSDAAYMRMALRLARRGYGRTSPNPMVGAVLVKNGRILGRGWHHRAGAPHAEVEALRDARSHRRDARGATLYVTLEPCSTHGRTPPCTEAIIAAGIRKVVAGSTDPNPRHSGKGFDILREAGLSVESGVLREECESLNEAFNHWIVHQTPLVTVKAAMTLDGKIATASGESKWITGEKARAYGMHLRLGVDAILVGINTVLADNPKLTIRGSTGLGPAAVKPVLRLVLDSMARTPLTAHLVSDEHAALTTIVASERAPRKRLRQLAQRVSVLVLPVRADAGGASAGRKLDLGSLLTHLGKNSVTSLLVEGGGEVNASFLLGGFAQRVAFFYAPKILGGRESRSAVAGAGVASLKETLALKNVRWRRLGPDWLLEARLV